MPDPMSQWSWEECIWAEIPTFDSTFTVFDSLIHPFKLYIYFPKYASGATHKALKLHDFRGKFPNHIRTILGLIEYESISNEIKFLR